MLRKIALCLFVLITLFVTSAISIAFADDDDDRCKDREEFEKVAVSGVGVHDFTNVIVHKTKHKRNGRRETTTESIDLTGDLEGRVLYQPTGVYDYDKGTLVNTGRQVFSGTILGSRPVMLFDDNFRFDLDLINFSVKGKVFLSDRLSGPNITCEIEITGDTPPANGKGRSTYSGFCWVRKSD